MTSRPPNQSTSRPLRPKHSVRLGKNADCRRMSPLLRATYSSLARLNRSSSGRFLPVGADDAHAGQRLLDDRAHVRELRLNALEAVVDRACRSSACATVTPGSGMSAMRVSRQSIASMTDNRDHKTERRAREVHDGRADHHADRAEVVGGPGHEIARAVGLEIRERQAFQVRKKRVPQVILDLPGRADKPSAHQVAEAAVGDRQRAA